MTFFGLQNFLELQGVIKYCVFSNILKYSGLWPFSVFPRCQCVYTMAVQTPALQENYYFNIKQFQSQDHFKNRLRCAISHRFSNDLIHTLFASIFGFGRITVYLMDNSYFPNHFVCFDQVYESVVSS